MKNQTKLFFGLVLVSCAVMASDPNPFHFQDYPVDSGQLTNQSGRTSVIYDQTITVPEATWLR